MLTYQECRIERAPNIRASHESHPLPAIQTGPMREGVKTITVLATDIVGSTEMLERLGQRASVDLTTSHLELLRDALAIHQGTLVKTMGDGVLATFSSVQDAVACAVTIQRSLERFNRDRADGLGVRIGIATGDAVSRHDDWFGRCLVEATRLCAASDGGQIYLSDLSRRVGQVEDAHALSDLGEIRFKGLHEPIRVWSVEWSATDTSSLRVALADDAAMLRQGIALVLREAGMEVVLEAGDGTSLIQGLAGVEPHVCVLDVRMPPTHTTEGLDTAQRIRELRPEIGILMLSASVDPAAAHRLLSTSTRGVGYLLKDRVADVDELAGAVRTVAAGGSVIDPAVIGLMRPSIAG